MNSQKKAKMQMEFEWDFWRVLSTIFLISWLIFFWAFFHYVSIGDRIGEDCCGGDKGEQFWNLGIFIAILSGLMYFLDFFIKDSYLGGGFTIKSVKPSRKLKGRNKQ